MSDDEDWNDIFREQGPERARETFNEKIKEGHANDGGKGAPRDEDDDAYDGMFDEQPTGGAGTAPPDSDPRPQPPPPEPPPKSKRKPRRKLTTRDEEAELLAEMNRDNCVVLDGGKVMVLRFEKTEHEAGGERYVYFVPTFLTFAALHDLYLNRGLWVGDEKKCHG